jgi:hypothetical protein
MNKVILPLAFFGALLGVVIYQIISGKLLGRNLRVYTTRSERPVLFWTVITIQGTLYLVGFLLVLVGRAR